MYIAFFSFSFERLTHNILVGLIEGHLLNGYPRGNLELKEEQLINIEGEKLTICCKIKFSGTVNW